MTTRVTIKNESEQYLIEVTQHCADDTTQLIMPGKSVSEFVYDGQTVSVKEGARLAEPISHGSTETDERVVSER